MAKEQEISLKIDGVYKDFRLPHEAQTTVKSLFTQFFKTIFQHKTIETQHALRDISFEIKRGEFFGIVGRNGSGKSTLLKILAGIYQPSKGKVLVEGKLVPFIELGVGFNPELTGRENVYLNGALTGFSRQEIDDMYDEVVEFAELEKFMDQKLKNYSSGMQVRLAFSMAIRANADILLVDEVLAVGDADFQRKCYDYFRTLKRNKKTVVFVSHDMNSIEQFCDRVAFIEKSKLVMLDDASTVADAYKKMFLEEASKRVATNNKNIERRWGDSSAVYRSVTVKVTKSGNFQLKTEVKAHKRLEKPSFGFLVKNFAGQTLMGSNTTLTDVKVDNINEGSVTELVWDIPDVFNEGTYYIDVALSYNQGVVADWWQSAAEINVVKTKNTPYLVNPKLKARVVNKND